MLILISLSPTKVSDTNEGEYMKAFFTLSLILSFLITSLPFYPFILIFPYFTKKKILAPILSFYSKLILKALGLKVTGDIKRTLKPGSIIVANHLSYLDLFLISSVYKGSFISTMEVKADPIFGKIATLAGCIFIERRNKSNIKNEIKVVEEHLNQGVNVFFFPEAKSTNGEEVHPFKRPFFTPAMNLNKDILAVTINYLAIDGEKINSHNRDKVFWYRQNDMLAHLKALMKIKSINIDISAEYIQHGSYQSSSLHPAQIAQSIVQSNYVPVI